MSKSFLRVSAILQWNLEQVVGVELKGGGKLRGRLKLFDGHLNLVLGETDDVTKVGNRERLGLVMIRGDSIMLIFPSVFKEIDRLRGDF